MRNPIRDPFTIPYGAAFGAIRAGGARTHQGLDEHCPEGTSIFAGVRGKVVGRGYTSGYGNYIDITYPGSVHVRYAHMQYPASLSYGQSWTDTEPQLGLVGKTGSAAYGDPPGAHLHVEVRVFGNLVDPAKFFTHVTPAGGTGTEIEIGDDMPLDSTDKAWLNGLGQSIIEQVLGVAAYAAKAGTVASVRSAVDSVDGDLGRLAGYVRREARARLFQNTITKQFMIADVDGVYYETLKGGQAEVDVLKKNGSLLIASEEVAQPVDQQTWDSVIAKIEATRAAVRGTASGTTAPVDPAVIQKAVEAVVPKIVDAVMAELFRRTAPNV